MCSWEEPDEAPPVRIEDVAPDANDDGIALEVQDDAAPEECRRRGARHGKKRHGPPQTTDAAVAPGALHPSTKMVSFVKLALEKLVACKAAFSHLESAPAWGGGADAAVVEEEYKALCTFCCGMSRNLKAAGDGMSREDKASIRAVLLPCFDIGSERPGPKLRRGGEPALEAALEALLAPGGPLCAAGASHRQAMKKHEEHHDRNVSKDQHLQPPDLEKMDYQAAVRYMWEKIDKPNRMERGVGGFELDLQSKGRYDGADAAKNPLFKSVNARHPFWRNPVTKTFIALLDNYEREVGRSEVVTQNERRENAAFMAAVCRSSVMRFALQWLKLNGRDPRCKKLRTMHDLEHILNDLWMVPYSRKTHNDSSGFEHVFVGEEKDGAITGLHNWVQFYLEEKKGNIDYLGWQGKQDSDHADDCNVASVKFKWDDNEDATVKPMSTILCGSTIEFELAVLTMAFLGGDQNGGNALTLGSERLNVKCYAKRSRYGVQIGTAYLEVAGGASGGGRGGGRR